MLTSSVCNENPPKGMDRESGLGPRLPVVGHIPRGGWGNDRNVWRMELLLEKVSSNSCLVP